MRTKILHVMPSLVPYGAEKTAVILAVGTNRERFDVSMVSLFGEQDGGLAPVLRAGAIPIHYLDKKPGMDTRMYGRLGRLFEKIRPDVIHTNNYVLRYTLLPALRANIPVQVHTVQNLAEREVDRVGRWLQSWAFRGKVCPVSIAEKVSDSFEEVYGLPRPALIPNAVDVELFSGAKRARTGWRQREGFREEDLLFVCAARFFEQKNHKMLLNAFAAGPAKYPAAKLLLAGDGGLQHEIEQQAEQLQIRDRVFFLGRRHDMPAMLGAVDVFTISSIYEGNPLSVMEAMAAGLPVVATSVGGIPELIEDGRSGFLVDSGDAAAFSNALMKLTGDPELLQNMGQAAARRALDKFDQRVMVRDYEILYEKLLAEKGIRREQSSRAA